MITSPSFLPFFCLSPSDRHVGKGTPSQTQLISVRHIISCPQLFTHLSFLFQVRVTKSKRGERNFHVFYQLLSGADVQFLKVLKLHRNVDKYELLRNTFATEEDKAAFASTRSSLEKLGFSAEETLSVFRILAVILKLGNLSFLPITNIDGTEGCSVSNDFELIEIAQLLDIDAEILLMALTRAEVEFGPEYANSDLNNWTELDAIHATVNKGLLCRTLYGRLFTWLVNRINEALKVSAN